MLLSTSPPDKFICLGLGIAVVILIYHFREVPDAPPIKNAETSDDTREGEDNHKGEDNREGEQLPAPHPPEITQETENAVSSHDLREMYQHSNRRVRQSVANIVARRAMNSPPLIADIIADSQSPNPNVSDPAWRALAYLATHHRSLMENPYLDQHARSHASFMSYFRDESTVRRDNVADPDTDPQWWFNQRYPDMLRRAFSEEWEGEWQERDELPRLVLSSNELIVHYSGNESGNGASSGANEDGPVRRPMRNTSERERANRRRRREAIVLNEGDHPLGQGDIYQRGFPFMGGR